MRSKLWLKILPVLLLLAFSTSAFAQTPFEPIYTSRNLPIVNVRWSDDSMSLVFQENLSDQDLGVISPNFGWHEYRFDRQSEDALVSSDFWPLQPTQAAGIDLALAIDYRKQLSFVFVSPDKRYAVYAASKPPDWGEGEGSICWPLAITDLQTGATVFVVSNDFEEIVIVCPLNSFANFDIRWSADSSAFTVELHLHPDDRSYHVTGLESLGTEIIASRLEIFSDDGNLSGYADALNISSDGKRVLSVNGPSIFMWDSHDPKRRHYLIRTERIPLAAMFVPDNEQKIMYISETGLMEYDLETQEIITLDAGINSEWAHDAWFSPDGKQVALIDKNTTKLYVLDVPLS